MDWKRFRDRLRAFTGAWLSRLGTQLKKALLTDVDVTVDTADGERAEARAFVQSAAELRGGMAKLAQLSAYTEGPGAVLDGEARTLLGTLWDRVPGVEPQSIRRVIEEDLGALPDLVFAHFSDEPLAAASLGQVHAATSHDGFELAIKVQYPGVADALRDDLSSSALVKRLAGSNVGGSLSAGAVAVLRAQILAELDYRVEAENLIAFGRAFAGDPRIVIPGVYPTLSSLRVLTMERLHGTSLARFASVGSASERAAVAQTIFRFAWGGPLLHGLLNADPNPGNYLVLDDTTHARGRVGFLDFGCACTLDPELVDADRLLWKSMILRDGEGLRYALHVAGLVEDPLVYDTHSFRSFEQHLAAPFLTRGEFALEKTDVRELTRLFGRLVHSRSVALPPRAILLWRQRLGALAVIASLTPRLDFRAALAELLEDGHPQPLLARYP